MPAHSTGICNTKGSLGLACWECLSIRECTQVSGPLGLCFPRLSAGSLIHTYDWRTHKENIVHVFVCIHMCWGGVHVEAIGHHWIFSLITFYGLLLMILRQGLSLNMVSDPQGSSVWFQITERASEPRWETQALGTVYQQYHLPILQPSFKVF